jgi:signal transduction histidine kinase
MPNHLKSLGGQAGAQRVDFVTAAVVVIGGLAGQAGIGTMTRQDWTIPVVIVLSGIVVAVRRRRPWPAAVLFAAGGVLVAIFHQTNAFNGPTPAPLVQILAVALVSYSLAIELSRSSGLAALAMVSLALLVSNGPFNPFLFMITLGPWLAGRTILSRQQMVKLVEARNRELEDGRELFVQERVRYERARIARELHDIVAHCITLVVVQAGAGQRLNADGDLDGAQAALEAISEALAEAQSELGWLLDMVARSNGETAVGSLEAIAALVERTRSTGATVLFDVSGQWAALEPEAAETASRLVQESLTNAVKHAPGSPVDVRLGGDEASVEILVATVARQEPARSGLEASGSGRGLIGMRERVLALGGTFRAGPTPSGAWEVVARFPSAAVPAAAPVPTAEPVPTPQPVATAVG